MPPAPLPLDIAWILMAAFLVAVMQAGFTCLESGFVRAKNSINVAIKNLIDFCISSLLFTLFGYSLMFGPTHGGWVGDFAMARYDNMDARELAFFLFELMFCGTAATIISGAVSERMRFVGYVVVTVVIAGMIYPIAGHWAWNGLQLGQANGWLAAMGFMDFAGSTVVHGVGGWISLSAILVVGPRIGRFGPDGHRIEGHNLPMSVLGVFLLWFGFFGFNGGSTLAFDQSVPLIVANTALAGAAGGIGGVLLDWAILRHPSVGGIVNGTVAGLVAICAGCNVVGESAAIIIGAVAGMATVGSMWVLERLKIDDVIGAVPAHLTAGIWGTIAVALFAKADTLAAGGRIAQLGVQLTGIMAIGLFALPLSYALFRTVDRVFPFRVTPEQERVGLNISEHKASSSLLDLITQMDWQARTGNFSTHIEVENETEASRVSTFYNAVLDKFNVETQRRQVAMDRLTKLASTDALTDLPNRRAFFDTVRRSLAASHRNGRQGAVMFLDLDGFKAVNDTMGHEAGDEVLIQVTKRLLAEVRESDLLARLGGDEFALLIDEIDGRESVEAIATKLVDALKQPFELRQGTGNIGGSIGIAVFGGVKAVREEGEVVVQRADDAMYEAKLAGKGMWRISAAPMAT